MKDEIRQRFDQTVGVIQAAGRRLAGRIEQAIDAIVQCYRAGGTVFLFGNGGSAADAQHIAAELVGRFLRERPALRAHALTTDSSVLTSVANDYDFAEVFARQLQAGAGPADVAVALTTSGDSANVVAGLRAARAMGMKTIALTGAGGGRCAELADILLDVPCSGPSPRIQEAHAVIYHVLCEFVERAMTEA